MFTVAQLIAPPYGREPFDPTWDVDVHYTDTVDDITTYLSERAARYGGTVADMLDKTPPQLWDNPTELRAFWDTHDLSHIYPQSVFPDMADDWTNIVAESSSDNRARGAEIMTHDEIVAAEINSDIAASDIDADILGDSPEFASDLIDAAFG